MPDFLYLEDVAKTDSKFNLPYNIAEDNTGQ